MENKLKIFLLGIIILLGSTLRIHNLNWDNNFHLHPDERFLTMVSNDISLPESILEYFDPGISTLNPTNNGYDFFVYGMLPLTINKIIATFTNNDTYDLLTLNGRFLSAIADIITIIVVYKLALLFEKRYKLSSLTKYLAALLYSIAVLPIQLAHFFTVDTFLNLFITASIYFAFKYYIYVKFKYFVLAALFFGFALASKVNGIFALPLIGILLLTPHIQKSIRVDRIMTLSLIFFGVTYISFRTGNPYFFQNQNIFIPTPNPEFIESIKTLRELSTPDVWFPPSVQWINKIPVAFSLLNFAFFGIGLPYFICLVIGIYVLIKRYRNTMLLFFLLWTIMFFLYQSLQFSQNMRYFIFLYPFSSVMAAMGIIFIYKKLPPVITGFLLSSLFIWPLAFFSIYLHSHSRIAASTWIYDNLPNKSRIISEHWDDSLPLQLNSGKEFEINEMPSFDQDTPEKWARINALLEESNYLILSSNRGWGSIPTVPERYPQMTKFYEDLFKGQSRYKLIAEFNSYPSLEYLGFPITIPDSWASEDFTVYDHPKVMIFKKFK